MPKQPPSSRASGHVSLVFGMAVIPVSVYAGTTARGLERKEYITVPVMEEVPVVSNLTSEPFLDRNGEPITISRQKTIVVDGKEVPVTEDHSVGRGSIDKTNGRLLEPGTEVLRKVSTEYGPVYVEDGEVEGLFELIPDTLTIKAFQPQALFHQGHYVPKKLSFLEPRKEGSGKKKGPNPLMLRLLGTLFEGMRKEGVMAVAELVTRGVPKECILMPDATLWEVYTTDCLREQREPIEVPVTEQEVTAMRTLIGSLLVKEPMDLTDERSALIQNFADEKARAGDFTKPEDVIREAEPAPALDILALLTASVDKAKQDRQQVAS